MRTIYIDGDYKCHAQNDGEYLFSEDVDFFDNVEDGYIECFRFVPQGKEWVSNNGNLFAGPFLMPFKSTLAYEYNKLFENSISLDEAANLIETIYDMDLMVIG